MTNTFKKIAIVSIATASIVAGTQASNAAGGMNALANLEIENNISKVGFFKKGGRFTNRGTAVIGLGAAVVGGLIASKVAKKRAQNRARTYYAPPRRYYKPRATYTPRHTYKKRTYARRSYQRPVYRAAFNQATFNTQTWLNQLGYNSGVADGKMGNRTRGAIMQFQLANGMPATGALTPQQSAMLAQQASARVAPIAPAAPVQQVFAPAAIPGAVAPTPTYPAYQAVQQQPRVIYVTPQQTAPVQQVAPQVQYAPQVQQVRPVAPQVAPQLQQVAPQVQAAPQVQPVAPQPIAYTQQPVAYTQPAIRF